MTSPDSLRAPSWQRLQRGAWAVGGASAVLCAAAALLDAAQVLRSYLAAFTFWLGIALGSVAIWMVNNLTGGAWGLALRRLLEAGSRTLPLMAVLFLPLALTTAPASRNASVSLGRHAPP